MGTPKEHIDVILEKVVSINKEVEVMADDGHFRDFQAARAMNAIEYAAYEAQKVFENYLISQDNHEQ